MTPVSLQVVPLPVGAVLGLMGLLLFVLGVRDAVAALRYRLGRPTPIGDLTPDSGRVVVSGVARRADDVVDAPLSGASCLAYSWRVTELRTQRGLDGSFDTYGQGGESGRGAVPFLVEDDTGRVLVDPEGTAFRLAEEWIREPVSVPDDRSETPALAISPTSCSGWRLTTGATTSPGWTTARRSRFGARSSPTPAEPRPAGETPTSFSAARSSPTRRRVALAHGASDKVQFRRWPGCSSSSSWGCSFSCRCCESRRRCHT